MGGAVSPAARVLVRSNGIGRPVQDVLGIGLDALGDGPGHVITISAPQAGLRDYRVNIAGTPARSAEGPRTQLVLEDVSEERAEGQRVHRLAGLLLKVREEERRRIAQELHAEHLPLLAQM